MPRKPVVLVVEPDRDSRSALGLLLADWGFKARLADGGGMVAASAEGTKPSACIVFLDSWKCPRERDAAREWICSRAEQIPTMIVTADFGDVGFDRAGCENCVVVSKPVAPGRIRSFLDQL